MNLLMLYRQLQALNPSAFRRACGVKRETFWAMVKVLKPYLERQGKRGGQNSLSVEDQLLMGLQKRARIPHPVPHWTRFWRVRSNCLPHGRKG